MKSTDKGARRALGLSCVFLSVVAVACGGGDGDLAAMSDDEVASSVDTKLSSVEDGLRTPTGVVDAQMARRAYQNRSGGPGDSVGGLAGIGGAAGGVKPKFFGAPGGSSCYAETGGGGYAIDVACATGGRGRGRLTVRAVSRNDSTRALMNAEGVCIDDERDGTSCMDGWIAYDTRGGDPQTWTMAWDLTATSGGRTESSRGGYRMTISRTGTLAYEIVVSDEGGKTVAVKATASGSSGELELRGANGTYRCTYSDGGEHGRCTGDGEVTW
jgi:hypothetical protein